MKTAALLFFAIATYMLGAVAQAVAAPYEALTGLGGAQAVSWQFSLIAPIQMFGAGFFLLFAAVQAIVDFSHAPTPPKG